MNNSSSVSTAQAPKPIATNQTYAAHFTPEQKVILQADLEDREQQASSLAAAGLVADSVDYNTRLASSVGQVLRAPPALGIMPMPVPLMGGGTSSVPLSSHSNIPIAARHPGNNAGGVPQVESINWNLDVDSAGPMLGSGLDDIDMDFATLFDSEEQMLTFDAQR